MESKELFYILIIIILVLHFVCNNKDTFMNLRGDHKKKVGECCKGEKNCVGKPQSLKNKDCEENKKKSNIELSNQYNSKFKSLDDFYSKRPNFESHYGKLEPQQERVKNLKNAVKKSILFPASQSKNIASKSGKPGFYVR